MTANPTDFNLQPDPRILPMLGEINLQQWRCIAELVDNAVDGFLSGVRAGSPCIDPEVLIDLPTRDDAGARVTVTDNGPGMPPERLEMAVRAGWSGNNPIESLGMFGMGFNIATARLGTVTTVWTSQAGQHEEHGLRVDFDELRRQRHFRTPRLTRPKEDPQRSGTVITIEKLKPEQRAWLSKPANRANLKQELAKSYSSMIRPDGVPITFRLIVNGRRVLPSYHCVWSEDRSVEHSHLGTILAVQKIDRRLPDRPFCMACWQWLTASDQACPSCNSESHVVRRKRHVHGWLGLQRYLSSSEYGIDFIRNGRKIEIGNRDLFMWRDPSSGQSETEYPIDDPRGRGRFVGEIHLDHCRVTYMKDRFDRTDPAWDEMVAIVRGEGPLQPKKASERGFAANSSPLYKLYQAFRRSSPPKARVAGGWATVLVVKDNDRAEDMARQFHEDVPEYRTDDKWWELVQEEDNQLLAGGAGHAGVGGPAPVGLPGFNAIAGAGERPVGGEGGVAANGNAPAEPLGAVASFRTAISSLSREYVDDGSSLRWDVRAFDVAANDPDLGGETRPWMLRRQRDGSMQFLVHRRHPIFRSATMTELDGLLCELAHLAADFTRNDENARSFGEVLAGLRDRYAGPFKLDAVALTNNAEMLFRGIARAWSRDIDAADANALFNDLAATDREAIHHKMAARAVPNPSSAISEGRFLEFATPRIITAFVLAHPELFFDGRCWEDAYADLDYLHPAATEEARRQVLQRFEALLLDARWLAEQDVDGLQMAPRERVLRAALAISLLTPAVSDGAGFDA